MAEWMMYRYTGGNGSANGSTTPVRPPTSEAKQWDLTMTDALGRTISVSSAASIAHSTLGVPMDTSQTRNSVSSASTTHSAKIDDSVNLSSPFVLRHGRKYLGDLPYPLPCDLPELQRQNLSTLLSTSVFGRPMGSTPKPARPPHKILEIACGTGYWSSLCHGYLSGLGYENLSFTGIDIAPIAGDLKKQGINWNFVQHDLRKVPLPFDDGEFDLILMKDLTMVVPLGSPSQRLLDDTIRILKPGGTLEVWETDHIIRSILPHPPPPPGKNPNEYACAVSTGTFLMSPITPFTEAHNKFLRNANGWIQEALDKRKFSPTPCTRISQVLLQETESLRDFENRRVAVPLGELRWEREAVLGKDPAKRRASEVNRLKKANHLVDSLTLTEEQAALRYTALLVVVQLIESLEPILKEVSGKNQEEWQRWWGWMMADLLEQKGACSGECLEMGVWWCQKV